MGRCSMRSGGSARGGLRSSERCGAQPSSGTESSLARTLHQSVARSLALCECDHEALEVLVARPVTDGGSQPVRVRDVPDEDALLVEAGRGLRGVTPRAEGDERGLLRRGDDLVALREELVTLCY